MRFHETSLDSVFTIELEPHVDDRGSLARAFCAREFAEHGLSPTIAQANLSFNHRRGTVRGLHYQEPPAAEAKVVRCVRGAIHDVAVDMRPESPTYGHWVGAELTAENGLALYIPELFAHGFQTLVDDTLVFYQTSAFYSPAHERGLRHDDPALNITWPVPTMEISDKDTRWPLLER